MFLKRWIPSAVLTSLMIAAGLGVAAWPQMQPQRQQIPIPGQAPDQIPGQMPGQMPPFGRDSDEATVISHRMQVKQAEQRNTDRQQELVKDTDQLFDLAKELKTDVDKTNKDVLSIDVVKKADEIEKLAKSVREKMKAN